MDEGGRVTSRNGRVGSKGQSRALGQGEALLQRKIREKEKKGYKEIDLVGAPSGGPGTAQIATAAEEQIGRGDPVVTELVRSLARINRHQLLEASGGQMDLDLDTGIVSTPLGVVTSGNLEKARRLLERLEPYVAGQDHDDRDFISNLEDYLMLVPQKVGSRQGWHREVLPDLSALTAQGQLLDQLETSIDIAEERAREAAKNAGNAPVQKIFDVALAVNEDTEVRRHVEDLYQSGRNRNHVSRHLEPARIFDVSLGNMDRDFEDDGRKVGGIEELWHGTRAHNLLSILKSGLIIPKSQGSIHVTGRMFGDGLYFSDQATKSLNYAYGFWDGGKRDDRCYMFLADVAMGRPWHPYRVGANVRAPEGYDSVFARGGRDRVRNNEMIVYRPSQARLRYLVEFAA